MFLYIIQNAYFDRDDVALKGFAKFFKDLAEEEHEHAEKLIRYQNLRGGRCSFSDVTRPTENEWNTALGAIEFALNLEKKLNQVLFISIIRSIGY